nr:biotin/lipoyl-containing protein [Aurantiacibacter odishensis]
MQDAEVVRWLKAVGDSVTEGEPIAEVEAAKTTVEVDCPVTGTLKESAHNPKRWWS